VLWPDSIALGGVALELGDVLADVQIHHGRSGVFDSLTASTCQLVLRDVSHDFARDFQVGQLLTVEASDAGGPAVRRFTGYVSDARLEAAELTIIATGALSTLRSYKIGTVDWPSEPWSARIARMFSEAGLPVVLVADPAFDPLLAARTAATAGPTTLGDYLDFLAPMIGAAIVDGLDGTIVVQALGARSLDGAVELDPADVAYAPAWMMALPIGNVVTVRYQADQGASVTVRDDASVNFYGREFAATIDTTFVNAADATARAQERLDRGAYSHWNILEAPVLRGVAEIAVGTAVVLEQMPEASPADPWVPIVEGWAETITRDDWRMELALSDPRLSGITPLPWEDAVGYAWNTVNPATAWFEAQSIENLAP
jgi:hypothetical protein